jgi:hypothetical protein
MLLVRLILMFFISGVDHSGLQDNQVGEVTLDASLEYADYFSSENNEAD